MNQITLLGRVGQDPQVKNFESGSLANFTMATDDSYKDKDGNKVERADWHNITVRGGLVSVVERYVRKGKRVLVQGKSKTRKYTDKDGNDRYVTEVHVSNLEVIDWPERDGGNNEPSRRQAAVEENYPSQQQQVHEGDLPF